MSTLLSSPNYLNYEDVVEPFHLFARGYMDHELPQYLVLDIADLVRDFESKWFATLACNMHDDSFKPDLYKIVKEVINSIRQEEEAELELASMAYNDIAAMSHYGVTPFGDVEHYNRVHLELSNLTVHFGKSIIARFKQEALYHQGHLPYRFHGWVGSTVYVSLDRAHSCSLTELNRKIDYASRTEGTIEGFPNL